MTVGGGRSGWTAPGGVEFAQRGAKCLQKRGAAPLARPRACKRGGATIDAAGGANRRAVPMSWEAGGIVPWQECLAARGRHGRQRWVSTRRVLLLAGGRLGFEGDILQALSLARSAVDDRLIPACPTAARPRPRSSTGPGKGQGRRRNARSNLVTCVSVRVVANLTRPNSRGWGAVGWTAPRGATGRRQTCGPPSMETPAGGDLCFTEGVAWPVLLAMPGGKEAD